MMTFVILLVIAVSVVGGEELNPPEFGTVQISIKPKFATYISDYTK